MTVDEHASQFLGTQSASRRCRSFLFSVGAALASITLLKMNRGHAGKNINLTDVQFAGTNLTNMSYDGMASNSTISVSYIDLYSNTLFTANGTMHPSGMKIDLVKEARLQECGKRTRDRHCTKHQPDKVKRNLRRRMAVLLRGEAFRHSGSTWCII